MYHSLCARAKVTQDSQDGALQGHAAAVTHITINERSSQIISLSADKVIKVLLIFVPTFCRLASSYTKNTLHELYFPHEQCKSLCIQHLYRTLHPCFANCTLVHASEWVFGCFAKLPWDTYAKLGFGLTASQAMHTSLHTGSLLGSQVSRTMCAGMGHPQQQMPANADRQAEASTRRCSDLPHVRFSAEAAAVWVCPTKGSTTCLSSGSAYKIHTSSERIRVAQADCSLCHVKPASNSSLCYSLWSLQHVHMLRFCIGVAPERGIACPIVDHQ